MKKTLLELTQDILSSMDADAVNSISDTPEAMQVATIVKNTYLDIVERASLPENYTLVNLESSGDPDKPVLMSVPSNVENVLWVKYNKEDEDNPDLKYQDVKYLPLEEFVDHVSQFSESNTEVDSMELSEDGFNLTFLFKNDTAPEYWTTFNDTSIVFDSYDSAVETTLQSSKTLCLGKRAVSWEMSDVFIPDLDSSQFPLLFNEAKANAWAELRQSQHPRAERQANRHWTRLQTSKYKAKDISDLDSLPNFGRKR
jgi:hypothetical protein